MSSQKLLPIILLVGLFAVLLVPAVWAVMSIVKVAPTGGSDSLQNLTNLTNVTRGYFEINITNNISIESANLSLFNVSQANANSNITATIITNGSGTGTANVTFWNLTNLINGSYSVVISLRGNVSIDNQTNVTSINFTVDTEAPSNIRLNKSNGIESLRNENTSDTTPELYINVTELMGRDQFVNVTVFRNNISYHSTTTTNGSFVLVNLSAFPYNGSHELQLQAIDRAGNAANGTKVYINIDNAVPINLTITLAATSIARGSTVKPTCAYADDVNGTGVQTVTLVDIQPDTKEVTATCDVEFTDTSKEGEHKFKLTVTDYLNQSATLEKKWTVTAPSGGGTTTGGKTTTSPTPTAAPVKEEQTLVAVEVGKVATVTFTKAELPVSEIILTPTEAGTNVKVSAETISAPSQGAPPASAADKEVVAFGYLDLKSTVAATAKVKFSVTRTWLTSNSVESNNVALYRLEGGTAWKKLTTTKLSEDATTVVYSAETPGFSVFAVAAEKPKAAAASPTSSPAASPATSPTSTAKPTTSPAAGKTGAPTDIWLYTGIAVAIIVIVVAVVLAMRRKK